MSVDSEFNKSIDMDSEDDQCDMSNRRMMGFQSTLMFGRYREDLGAYAKSEAERLRKLALRRKDSVLDEKELRKYKSPWKRKCFGCITIIWERLFMRLGCEDWFFLLVLGMVCSVVSITMDLTIGVLLRTRSYLYGDLAQGNVLFQYIAWVVFPILLILFSCGFSHSYAPQAIGSGIPELKTILRGVILKEYFTYKTLIAKFVGLTCALGSGLPLGKSIESRTTEMLSAACAVGVACTFAAPLGGVLFSIEVTSVYFAVRNYWRGFFAASCGALMWQLLGVWIKDKDTITPVFRTSFRMDYPYDLVELVVYAVMGIFCGLLGAMFVYVYKQVVMFNRKHKSLSAFLQKNRFLYPMIITFIISTATFPNGLGKFYASELTNPDFFHDLFSNFTWTSNNLEVEEQTVVRHWSEPPFSSIFFSLPFFILMNMWIAPLAGTIPMPLGVVIPIFKMGAAFGRIIGEAMALYFPNGIQTGAGVINIIPGSYAVAGAAAMAGAATRTISTCVIAFEITGQMSHILPILISVLVANAVAQLFQPSVYDLIIKLKKLPYLPPILPTSSQAHSITVEHFMLRDVTCIWSDATYKDIRMLLKLSKRLQIFPYVENLDNMILLGSIPRAEMLRLLELQMGRTRRLQEVARRKSLELSSKSPKETRRTSRFQVLPVTQKEKPSPRSSPPPSPPPITVGGHVPRNVLFPRSQYASVTSYDSRIRHAFETIFRRSANLVENMDSENGSSTPQPRRVQFARITDMSPEEQLAWEEEQMQRPVDFANCHIDPAPFQLVERTTLIKCHSMFSMLGLQTAYVTALGRLVGVVGLKELRKAIEKMDSGVFSRQPTVKKQDETFNNQDTISEAETQSEFEFDFDDISRRNSLSNLDCVVENGDNILGGRMPPPTPTMYRDDRNNIEISRQ